MSEVDESLISRIVAMGFVDLRCISKSIATLAPSTTSARKLFVPTGRIDCIILDHPFQVFPVILTSGTPPPLEPKVTSPILSLSPRQCTINFSVSRSRLIFKPCIDEETGITTTISKGMCGLDGMGGLGNALAEAEYSVGAVTTDLEPPYDEVTEETRLVVLVVR